MIEVTAKNGKQFEINENLIALVKPEPSGGSRVYLTERIANPTNTSGLTRTLQIQGNVEDLGLNLRKVEEIATGAYYHLNMRKVLSLTPTQEGTRAFLPVDISDSSTPFSNNKLHLREV